MAVGLFCGVLWVCFVVVVPHFYLFILFVIGDFVWSGLRKKIGDLGFFFFFFPYCGLVADGGGGGGCGCG